MSNRKLPFLRAHQGASGYVIRLLAQVKDGALAAQQGGVGQAGSLTLSGKIQPDGKASIDARGMVGAPKNTGNTRTPTGAPRWPPDLAACARSAGTPMTVGEFLAQFPEVLADLRDEPVLGEYVSAFGPLLRLAQSRRPACAMGAMSSICSTRG